MAAGPSFTLATAPASLGAVRRDSLRCQLDQSASAQPVHIRQQQPQVRTPADSAAARQHAVSSGQHKHSQSMPSLSNAARAVDQRIVGWTEVGILTCLLMLM